MECNPIYTIGYGARKVSEFLDILKEYGIKHLIDVRSKPYSRVRWEFSKEYLEKVLRSDGIRYSFMGDLLGGQPQDDTCWTDGKADYEKMQETPFYKKGIARLESAYNEGITICLMCSEQKPEECHRSKLIGRTLSRKAILVVHIDEGNVAASQESIMDRITGGQLDLFGMPLRSRKRYRKECE